jgi:hypothetical protein
MRSHARSAAWLALAAAALAVHYALILRLAPGLRLELGSVGCPRPGFLAFLASWWTLGCGAAAALAAAFAAWPARSAGSPAPESGGVSRAALAGWSALAAALAALVKLAVLDGAAVTDDEASYRFASELLAGGRLAVASPPGKEFFDHFLLLNDGRLRSVYFLGWPALRAVGVWLGAGAWVNVALFALTAPAVARLGRLWLGARWGAAATALFVTSPFLLVLAATDLSHTAAICCLAWAAWFARADARGAGAAALFGLALAAMFWVRPVAAIGYGAPLLALWLRERLLAPLPPWRAVAAFLVPAALLATLFLAAQQELFGSPWSSGYHRLREYHLANGAQFVPVSEAALRRPVPEFDFTSLPRALERTGCGLLRAGADFFGWPLGLLPLVAAIGVVGSAPAWAMFGGGLASVLFQRSPGIDTFGPVHYAELALPAAFLLAAAGRVMAARLARTRDAARATRLATAAFAALAVASWIGFVPARWASLRAVAESAAAPERLALREAQAPAVVFAPFPWVPPPCMAQPSRYFRWLRPISSPQLDDPIVWANHFDVDRDRALLERFPGRRGYVLYWEPTCELRLIPLDGDAARAIPPGRTRLGP